MKWVFLRERTALAASLADHPAVSRVHYPGLANDPDHSIAREHLRDPDGEPAFGGMLSLSLGGGADAARALLDRLELPAVGPSLGGVETLVTRPATTSHAGLTAAERAALGIDDGLVRVSVGIEASEDLIEDFGRGLIP